MSVKMHAFLSSQKLITVKTKSIVNVSCRCRSWNSVCSKHNKSLGLLEYSRLKNLQILPSIEQSSRLLSSLANMTSTCRNVGSITYIRDDFLSPAHRTRFVEPVGPYSSSLVVIRQFHVSTRFYEQGPLKPSSKVEETVQALKEDLKESEKPPTSVEKAAPVKKTLRQKIVHEIMHYYHGFRLLFIDIHVSGKLVWRVLNGNSLTRREHRLLVRTTSDLFRLLPFSVFIIVPFMELLLPLAIKMFPGMLPSTFQTATEKDDKMKQALKVKLEMAKFLQKTLDDMAVQGKGHRSDSAKEFAVFFNKIRTSGEEASNEEIMKFSKLFEDEITLDSLSRQQLTALCRVLEIQPLGTNYFLRFQLRMKLRSLAADDKVIEKEGIDQLTPSELQQACRARGMRAYGMTTERLRAQLKQWLDLSLHQKVPPSLLLLSRALLLPETISTPDQLKATISVLSDSVATQTKAAIGEREGKIDNKTKIEIIKEEQRMIKEERREQKEELKKEIEVDKELLVDKAPVLDARLDTEVLLTKAAEAPKKQDLSSTDLEALEDALDTVSKGKKKLLVEKEELDDLKEELAEYKEDVDDLTELQTAKAKGVDVQESKAAQRLYKKVNSMIGKMDAVLSELQKEERVLKEGLKAASGPEDASIKSQALVSIEDLMAAIKQMQKVPDESLSERLAEMLQKIDDDKDGSIAVDDVLKVIELVGKDNVKIDKKQLDEIIELLDKEEKIELEGQIERALAKETQQAELEKQEKQKKVEEMEKELSLSKEEDRKKTSSTPPLPLKAEQTCFSSAATQAAPPAKPATVDEPKDPQDSTKTL